MKQKGYMENIFNIDQIIVDDEMANLDATDTDIIFEADSEIYKLPLELKERILQGEYL